jgi:uncharacterized RDD family membrane protein YckC
LPRVITVVTPENIRIEYEVAGIGSRGGAAIVDLLLQGLIIAVIFSGRAVLEMLHKWPGTTWADALLGIASFVVYWGYYTYFETVWNGQTPGKRHMRLRTVKEGGMPIDLTSAAVRNLVRIIDFLPMLYVVGSISVLVTSNSKRLGDIAAGTLVVKERSEILRTAPANQEAAVPVPPIQTSYVKQVELVTPEEFEAAKRFMERKAELSPQVREEVAARIARPLIAKLGIAESPNMIYSGVLSEVYAKCMEERGMR